MINNATCYYLTYRSCNIWYRI